MFKKSGIITVISLLLLAFACSKKAKQELKKSDKFANGKPIEYEIEDNGKFVDIEVYTKIKPYLEVISKSYDSVKYFCVLDTNYFFYVSNGTKKGVVDKHGKVIVPVKYSKIFNPGGTVKGLIEVEDHKKFGLYDLEGNVVAEAKYESIYPVDFSGAIVQVKLDGKFGVITSEGEETFDEASFDNPDAFISPYLTKASLAWKFDVNSKDIVFLQPVNYKQYKDDLVEGRAVVFTPSYLFELGFLPQQIERIVIEKETDFGIAESKAKVTEVTSIWDGLLAAFAEYYEVGLDARGYETNKTNLVTMDSAGKVISTVEYYKPYMYSYPCGDKADMFKTRFVDSSLFEVKTYQYSYDTKSQDTTYDTYPEFFYYWIDSTGEITELSSQRRFAFTQFLVIDESYLRGCYAKFVNHDGEKNAVINEHLTIEDLEVMKNEIYADYGMIFTKPKWKNYFGKRKWYRGKLKNVDDLLTDVDRKNIAFITATIEKMKANPDDYVSTSEGTIPIVP